MEKAKGYVNADVLMQTVVKHFDRNADAAVLPRKVIEALLQKVHVPEDSFVLMVFDAAIANDGDVTTEELEEEIENFRYLIQRLVSQNTSSEEEADEVIKRFEYGDLPLVIPQDHVNLVFKVEWPKDKEEDC